METIPPMTESQSTELQTPATSLAAKFFNVFAAPGEVFAELGAAPVRVINWLVPVLIFAVVGVITVCILFAQPTIRQTIHDQQVKTFDQQVQQGKITQTQEDQMLQAMDRFMGPTMLSVFGSVGAVLNSFISVFWWALVLWLCGRWFLKARFNYMKAVEVVGLASVIIVLGMVISTLLAVILGRLYVGTNLAWLVNDFDAKNRVHLLLGATNFVYFWHTGVLGIGLAKLTGGPTTKAVIIIFTYWVVAELLLIAAGMGSLAL